MTQTTIRKQPQDIIRELESTSSSLTKKTILGSIMKEGIDEFFDGVKMCLDGLYVFGVKQVPVKDDDAGQGLPWQAFVQLAESLKNRAITGHDARDAILLAMSVATQDQWNTWYRRILIKDLRCGVSEKTVNAVAKDLKLPCYAVPVFSAQLAHDGIKHEAKITGKKILQKKLDGVRALTIIDYEAHTVKMYSRNGKEMLNFGHITSALETHIDEFGRSYVIDGEVMSDNFQALMTQLNRKDDADASDAILNVFDIIPLSEFKAGIGTLGQRRRLNLLNTFNSVLNLESFCNLVEWVEIDLDTFVGKVEYQDFNDKCLQEGYEGIMIKDPNALYECKRTVAWLKVKPTITVDLTIVDTEEGTGKNEGKLGAYVCEGIDDGRSIRVNVGTGISDDERNSQWGIRETLIGQVVEIKADAVTQNQDGTYSLRFPRFGRFRGFTKGEKL